jgi:hypothetical protein
MALTNAQIAKRIADTVNDSRGHTQGRNPVKFATYTSGSSFTVKLRSGETRTITISGS